MKVVNKLELCQSLSLPNGKVVRFKTCGCFATPYLITKYSSDRRYLVVSYDIIPASGGLEYGFEADIRQVFTEGGEDITEIVENSDYLDQIIDYCEVEYANFLAESHYYCNVSNSDSYYV